MSGGLAVGEVMPVLRALAATDAVLIGGQALQVWCDRYASAVEGLRRIAPLTSGDVDVQGDRDVVRVFAREFSVRPAFPTSIEDATNVGYLEVRLGALLVGVNVLTSAYGIDAREALAAAPLVDLGDGASIRVLHPVHCMESRIANVAGLGRTARRSSTKRGRLFSARVRRSRRWPPLPRGVRSIYPSACSVTRERTSTHGKRFVSTGSTRSPRSRLTVGCRISSCARAYHRCGRSLRARDRLRGRRPLEAAKIHVEGLRGRG